MDCEYRVRVKPLPLPTLSANHRSRLCRRRDLVAPPPASLLSPQSHTRPARFEREVGASKPSLGLGLAAIIITWDETSSLFRAANKS
ncbi:hypothetical protein RRG08_020676 [Elysia crispata]|uniref:Uncharacterized protein n=1 Tax=Elysia crispata TaxID=231223 RepID=A0AAE0Z626_9GAST|nr:hypothetical protein RRG08_020676 [Elysia crispata]